MKTIVITRPDFFSGETDLVNRLFSAGMERLHLRKPGAAGLEMEEWLMNIDKRYLGRIVLHDRLPLAARYGLGGIHLNSRNPQVPHELEHAVEQGLTVSRSCHSIGEVAKFKESCSYLFLSPIYDSISKEGYGAAFSREELSKAAENGIIDSRVYALGGVSLEHIPELRTFGFGGAAVLGALWQSADPVKYLEALAEA